MNTLKNGLLAGVFAIGCVSAANAQVNASDSVTNHVKGNRLSVGGYGEVAYSRMFYSDSYYRYQDEVMLVTIVLLIALVQLIQTSCDLIARHIDHR